MAHCFRLNAEWGKQLTARAPSFARNRSLSMRLVGDNDGLVRSGRFRSPDGAEHELPAPPPTERFTVPGTPTAMDAPLFAVTEVCIANLDTVSAAVLVGDATALNFANAYQPGGGYRHGASAQEEDLCRLLPQLIHSLEACQYPINPEEVLLTRNLASVRQPGTYQLGPSMGPVHMLTSAMPCGTECGNPGSETWNATVNLRMRAVLHAAKMSGYPNLILGAWGCGAFGNPPDLVSTLFREQLYSPEFRGAFSKIVFAVVDPSGDGNFGPFATEISKMDA